MIIETIDPFLTRLKAALAERTFVKMILSKPRDKSGDLVKVQVRTIETSKGPFLSFTSHHKTKDVVKNYSDDESITQVKEFLASTFLNADLFTTQGDLHLMDKNGKLIMNKSKATFKEPPPLDHNIAKKEWIAPLNNIYLAELGVTDGAWAVKTTMQDKYRQINKFIEIADGLVRGMESDTPLSICDMGAGKGYLTFALYDYLTATLGLSVETVGVEARQELVDQCNRIAKKCRFDHLRFARGSIVDYPVEQIDILIALHACDTATDEAIYKGIAGNARLIICAPCCHKQIRGQMKASNFFDSILRHGILMERQAEIVTDALRALILETRGYKVKVFEFISLEHTAKNVMIVAEKIRGAYESNRAAQSKIDEMKKFFGIEYHYLERLLGR